MTRPGARRVHLPELDVAAVATRLPADGETLRVELTGGGSPRGRGTHVDLPAFRDDPRRDPRLPGTLRRRIDRFSALAYLAVAELLDGLPTAERPARERIGSFFCNTRAGWAYGEPELGLLVDRGPVAMHAYQATAWFPAAAQGEVTIALDLRGCAKTTAGRETGFAEALRLARDALERGAVDMAVVGAAESLCSDFVLRDWPDAEPLPARGPAEGAVMFALRRPDGRPVPRLAGLDAPGRDGAADPVWVPTLSAAARLARAVTEPDNGGRTTVAVGGGHRIEVRTPATTSPTSTDDNEKENR